MFAFFLPNFRKELTLPKTGRFTVGFLNSDKLVVQ